LDRNQQVPAGKYHAQGFFFCGPGPPPLPLPPFFDEGILTRAWWREGRGSIGSLLRPAALFQPAAFFSASSLFAASSVVKKGPGHDYLRRIADDVTSLFLSATPNFGLFICAFLAHQLLSKRSTTKQSTFILDHIGISRIISFSQLSGNIVVLLNFMLKQYIMYFNIF